MTNESVKAIFRNHLQSLGAQEHELDALEQLAVASAVERLLKRSDIPGELRKFLQQELQVLYEGIAADCGG